MQQDFEVKVTTRRQAEVTATLGSEVYALKGEAVDGGAPYVHISNEARLLFTDIREADWPAFRDAVDKLFAALRAE